MVYEVDSSLLNSDAYANEEHLFEEVSSDDESHSEKESIADATNHGEGDKSYHSFESHIERDADGNHSDNSFLGNEDSAAEDDDESKSIDL